MSRNRQQSSVLPLMTWPSQNVISQPNKSPPPPPTFTKSAEKQDKSLVATPDSSLMTSEEWVHRASQLKEEADDVLSSRSPSFQQWQDRRTIRLLEEHWHAVTTALKKLSSEVIVLQSQVLNKEKADGLTGESVKSLAVQQSNFVQDLRGRIGRCDSSIAVISSDIRSLAKNLSAVNKQLALLSTDFEKGSKDVDQKVERLQTDLQEQTKQQHQTKSITEIRLEDNLTSVEFKTKNQLRELQDSIHAVQTEYQSRQKKLEQQLVQTLEQLTGKHQQNQAQFEKQMAEKFDYVQKRVTRLECEQEKLKQGLEIRDNELRSHISRQLGKMEEKLMGVLRVEVKDTKSSMQSGLGTMQSNLETMRRVLEGKQRLSEEVLKKDISRMKKLVVLT